MADQIDLDKLRKKKAMSLPLTANIEIDQSEQIELLKSVEEKLDKLWQTLNDKKEFDSNLFEEQFTQLAESLDVKQQLLDILTATENNKVEEVSVKDLTKIVEAIKHNKPIVNVDLSKLEKAIIQVQQRLEKQSVPNQAPEDYTPTRRVVKIGNRLVFDDQPTPTRGGGGGSSTGLTNTELRSSAVDTAVTSSVLPTGAATAANQSTANTALSAIQTAIQILDDIVSGSEAQVDIVGALPAGDNNIGNVDLASLIAGEDLPNDVLKTEQRASYANISADTLIKTGPGRLMGFMVNSHTTGTLKLWDNTSAATTVLLNTISFPVGSGLLYTLPAVEFTVGLYADVSGTIDITIFYK